MSEEVNRKWRARNTLVQLLALYTDPERHRAQLYRRTDRRTDDVMMPGADDTARSANYQHLSSDGSGFFSRWTCTRRYPPPSEWQWIRVWGAWLQGMKVSLVWLKELKSLLTDYWVHQMETCWHDRKSITSDSSCVGVRAREGGWEHRIYFVPR